MEINLSRVESNLMLFFSADTQNPHSLVLTREMWTSGPTTDSATSRVGLEFLKKLSKLALAVFSQGQEVSEDSEPHSGHRTCHLPCKTQVWAPSYCCFPSIEPVSAQHTDRRRTDRTCSGRDARKICSAASELEMRWTSWFSSNSLMITDYPQCWWISMEPHVGS